MDYKKLDTNVFDSRQMEHMQADIDKQQATTEYVALMAGVDIPEDDNGSTMGGEDIAG